MKKHWAHNEIIKRKCEGSNCASQSSRPELHNSKSWTLFIRMNSRDVRIILVHGELTARANETSAAFHWPAGVVKEHFHVRLHLAMSSLFLACPCFYVLARLFAFRGGVLNNFFKIRFRCGWEKTDWCISVHPSTVSKHSSSPPSPASSYKILNSQSPL